MGRKAALLLSCPLLFSCGLPGYDAAQGIKYVRELSCPELTRGRVEFCRSFGDGQKTSYSTEFDLEKGYLHTFYETPEGNSIEKWVYGDDLGEGSRIIQAYRLVDYPFDEQSGPFGYVSGDIAFLSDYDLATISSLIEQGVSSFEDTYPEISSSFLCLDRYSYSFYGELDGRFEGVADGDGFQAKLEMDEGLITRYEASSSSMGSPIKSTYEFEYGKRALDYPNVRSFLLVE